MCLVTVYRGTFLYYEDMIALGIREVEAQFWKWKDIYLECSQSELIFSKEMLNFVMIHFTALY